MTAKLAICVTTTASSRTPRGLPVAYAELEQMIYRPADLKWDRLVYVPVPWPGRLHVAPAGLAACVTVDASSRTY